MDTGNCLSVQWSVLCASTAEGLGSISGRGANILWTGWCSEKKKKGYTEPMSRKMWPRTSPRRQQRRLEMEDGEVKRPGGWKLMCRSRRRPGRAWRHVHKFPRMKTDESLQLEKAPHCGWRKILRPHHSGIQTQWRQSCYLPAFRWWKSTTYNEARMQLTSGFSTAYREFDFLNKYNSEPRPL